MGGGMILSLSNDGEGYIVLLVNTSVINQMAVIIETMKRGLPVSNILLIFIKMIPAWV